MPYAEVTDVKDVLSDQLTDYDGDVSEHLSYADTIIDSKLAGHFTLPFDDVAEYPNGIPTLIVEIASYLTAWRIWDKKTVLEGQLDDTAAGRWKMQAMDMLQEVAAGDLVLLDPGTNAVLAGLSTSGPRSYPSGKRDKAPSSDNDPYFTKAQAGEW